MNIIKQHTEKTRAANMNNGDRYGIAFGDGFAVRLLNMVIKAVYPPPLIFRQLCYSYPAEKRTERSRTVAACLSWAIALKLNEL